MNRHILLGWLFLPFLPFCSNPASSEPEPKADAYTSWRAQPGQIKMFWKKDGKIIGNLEKLAEIRPDLAFAMNGGMFTADHAPVGLYVEEGRELRKLKRYNNPRVNFGLQPQGIFLIRNGRAEVIPVEAYKADGVSYATQSAPMLVLNGKINPALPNSNSTYIRNGVGLLPDGRVLLALSHAPVTFRQFAQYFLDQGCTAALYLDGAVSEAFTPGRRSFGSFGVLIAVLKETEKTH